MSFARTSRKQLSDSVPWEVLSLCRQSGLVKLGHVALDGTKVRVERIEAQGDELRTDEREGSAVIGGG